MESMQILSGVYIYGLTLYIEDEKTLLFGDMHLGYEEELNQMGYLIPRFQYDEIINHLTKVFSHIAPERVVICGDLKHEFGRISEQEWNEVMNFLSFIERRVDDIVLIKGNHDTILGPIATKRNVKFFSNYYLSGRKIFITHGHLIPEDPDLYKAKIVIIGHDHPALGIRDELRVEKVKCFLLGKWRGKDLIQIPSLNFVTEGIDIIREKPLSPFMNQDLSHFRVYCIENDEIFDFGRISTHLESE
ncbi:MAG: phosphoesterase [Candidatus Altiarchaeales archaeon]|nr:MAG: phosphoesterase [Candidatus Altiarchaeales archaeon]